jgi:hypothetical protein
MGWKTRSPKIDFDGTGRPTATLIVSPGFTIGSPSWGVKGDPGGSISTANLERTVMDYDRALTR